MPARRQPPKTFLGRLQDFIESSRFQNFIIALILINAVTLALETAPSVVERFGEFLHWFDQAILAIFVAELLAKLVCYRLKFFQDGWNWFDFIIVVISLIPAAGSLSVLRALRILRVLRLLSLIPSMRMIVEAGIRALPGMGSIVLVLGIVYFVSSVLATKLFGSAFPEMFGTLGDTAFTLFAIMTLEGWADIAREVQAVYPQAWAFFIPFIVITAFMVLNLFIGVIVGALQSIAEEDARKEKDAEKALAEQTLSEVRALRAVVEEMRARAKVLESSRIVKD
jgi:voltage-gated sodium channel